ncbi:glycoside hydrolase family 3 N-terminal domain-containing protein [Marinomonas sp. FW-1]|uniref:glycoside hydrolase family 3 protein n=1 Tax=Marinomonas sp. FW-1 TaxID=2071621 RepID=UPI0010C13D2E|nr:glycoside hydrolase family 3 N-terminal domain-containing protein [Marinomonas sp. FW-1]
MAKKTIRSVERLLTLSSAIALLAGCSASPQGNFTEDVTTKQANLVSKIKPILAIDGLSFKDLNQNGQLDPYEDWRLPTPLRVDNLVKQMTLQEKAGLMLIDTLNSGCEGLPQDTAQHYIKSQNMRRFIFRNVVTNDTRCGPDRGIFAGSSLTPAESAHYMNQIQEMAENSRLGIPVLQKSNARNHFDKDPKVGINEAAGAFTQFPKEPGLAAAVLGEEALHPGQGMEVIKTFSEVIGSEWRSIGLRGMYGYMADLGTEPRWHRFHETFTENADLDASIMTGLVEGLQGGPVNPDTNIALTLKHFPGGGPQEMGLDPHYSFGKNQVYPAGQFEQHLKPFQAAIDAGVSSIMPYYGVPIDVVHNGVKYEQLGSSFSKQIVTDLLRDEMGFKGYVNTDTGIVDARAWGLEDKTVPERVAQAIQAGADTISGFHDAKTITDLVDQKLLTEARINESAKRLLTPMFKLGLFENPYVTEGIAQQTIGNEKHQKKAMEIMQKSIVLLQNKTQANNTKVLPLKQGAHLYVMGMAPKDIAPYGYKIVNGEPTDKNGKALPRPSAKGSDYALIRVEVKNASPLLRSYRTKDAATGNNPKHINPLTNKTWGSEDPCNMFPQVNRLCVDDMFGLGLIFGGAVPWEVNNLSFTSMAASESWKISPSLEDIQAVMKEVGAENTILNIYFRNPYVLDEASGLKNAGAILAGFGVNNKALMDVISGRFAPQGKMPFALPNSLKAVLDNAPDAPGYPKEDTLFDYNFGLTY